jgi:Protein of unknown function (DUF2914)
MMRFAKLGSAVVIGLSLVAMSTTAGAEGNTSAKLSVKRLALAHGIDGHEPEEVASTFRSNEDRVYAFVELANPSGAEDAISVVFQPPHGAALPEIPLKVGKSARFRTWAFSRQVHDAGEWTVVIRGARDRVLARQTFTVTR